MGAIISVEGLGKKYRIRHGQEGSGAGHKTMRELLSSLPEKLKSRFAAPTQSSADMEDFWALKDVSFDVQPGDRVGIIGRNGAGKSTLLKLLSRITEPSVGKITLRGRLASLLEVGTGFHPELTGRENIFLNGAILGMSRAEVTRKFDEIVDFSGVEKFLDTPVKRYSSGMYVRLAFAVAAHLEPEILVVDEVLAVGDAEFQKKCLGKMEEVGRDGRTVLFVSHNMGAVQQLCSRVLVIDHGYKVNDSCDINVVIQRYMYRSNVSANSLWINDGAQFSSVFFEPLEFDVARVSDDVFSGYRVTVKGNVREQSRGLQVGIAVFDSSQNLLFWACHNDCNEKLWPDIKCGVNIFSCEIPYYLLNTGRFRIDLLVAVYRQEWICEPGVNSASIYFDVDDFVSESPYWNVTRPGLLAPKFVWDVTAVN